MAWLRETRTPMLPLMTSSMSSTRNLCHSARLWPSMVPVQGRALVLTHHSLYQSTISRQQPGSPGEGGRTADPLFSSWFHFNCSCWIVYSPIPHSPFPMCVLCWFGMRWGHYAKAVLCKFVHVWLALLQYVWLVIGPRMRIRWTYTQWPGFYLYVKKRLRIFEASLTAVFRTQNTSGKDSGTHYIEIACLIISLSLTYALCMLAKSSSGCFQLTNHSCWKWWGCWVCLDLFFVANLFGSAVSFRD